MSELAQAQDTTLVIPGTGEVLDLAIPEQAAQAFVQIKELELKFAAARRYASTTIIEESQRLGTKTLRMGGATFKISGGPGATSIDAQLLREGLREAGCPEERIEDAIKKVYTESVDRSVCRQLATNPAYKAAIERATSEYEKPQTVGLA